MARTTGRLLTARQVQLALTGKLPPGMYFAGGGLYLQKTEGGASWIYRYRFDKKRIREQGLGRLDLYGLKEARALALDARRLRHQGIDPIDHRRAARAQARLDEVKSLTFDAAAEQYAAAHRAGWRSTKHAKQWLTSLTKHASPVIGAFPVAAIDTPLVLKVLEPIWTTKPETASRVRGRIEVVLDFARVRGYRTDSSNPARWRGHLDHLLPPRAKVRRIRHRPALPYDEMPAFMAKLRNVAGPGARALEFLILTACRPGEVVNARWSEIDLQSMWIIPPERMKGGREHRVPLSSAALALLEGMDRKGERIFETSQTTLLDITHALQAGIVPHGFRSSFRDWCAERTNFPSEVAEMALAHVVGSKVEAAYRRGDMYEKRRRLMDAWAKFCTTETTAYGKVVSLKRRG